MADSFNGVPIFVLADDVPRRNQADVSYRHIPGSNLTYVDIGGAQLRRIDYSLLFVTGADALSFEAQIGVVGTLVTIDGTFTALLDNMRRVSHGVSAAGECVVQCEFVIV